jgi:hypothetical protein
VQRELDKFTVRSDGLDDRDGQRYVAQMVGMLRSFEQVAGSSRAILLAFRFYNRPVLIVPYDGNAGHCNATADWQTGMFSAKVWFTPLTFNTSPCSHYGNTGAGATPAEILVHELVHALRGVARKLNDLSSDDEERIAILVTNIFASEINKPMRERHADFRKVPDAAAVHSANILASSRALIQAFDKQQPNVTRMLGNVNAPFNPIRQYLIEKRSAAR